MVEDLACALGEAPRIAAQGGFGGRVGRAVVGRASWVVLCPVAKLSPEAEAGCLGEVEEGDLGAAAGDGTPPLLAGRWMSGGGGVGRCLEAGGRGAAVAEYQGSEHSHRLG